MMRAKMLAGVAATGVVMMSLAGCQQAPPPAPTVVVEHQGDGHDRDRQQPTQDQRSQDQRAQDQRAQDQRAQDQRNQDQRNRERNSPPPEPRQPQ